MRQKCDKNGTIFSSGSAILFLPGKIDLQNVREWCILLRVIEQLTFRRDRILADWKRTNGEGAPLIDQKMAEELLGLRCVDTDAAAGGFGVKLRMQRVTELFRMAMYPNIFSTEPIPAEALPGFVAEKLEQGAELLYELTKVAFRCDGGESGACTDEKAALAVEKFLASLPGIMRVLQTDIDAAYLGDPAAKNRVEILLAYPAFEAISIYRLAHGLLEAGVPLLPRIMTEYAHQRTGIDIHPAARIGERFFIDHGTGVVIGETCVIGCGVKLYQGVTLGAKSFELDGDGNPVKGIKRHPDIGDRVVIYAGATILGGDTHIGHDSIIGGNVWLTHSVPPESKVYNTLSSRM